MHRQQRVVIDGSESSVHVPNLGVPQGSVVGPMLFTMYSSPLSDIIASNGMSGMCYADDTQVYVSFKPCDLHVAISQVEKCVKEIKQWSVANGLKLNDEKTEILHLSSRFRRRMQFPVIKIDDTSSVPSRNARNLVTWV